MFGAVEIVKNVVLKTLMALESADVVSREWRSVRNQTHLLTLHTIDVMPTSMKQNVIKKINTTCTMWKEIIVHMTRTIIP